MRDRQRFVPDVERYIRGIPECYTTSAKEALTTFNEILRPKAGIVYYPGCGLDRSPSEVFGDSRIIYVDLNVTCINGHLYDGREAYVADARAYDPGIVDIVILKDFYCQRPVTCVASGGYVISSDFWRTADEIAQREDFTLVGVLRRVADSDTYELDTSDLKKYLSYVETDEEFMREAEKSGTLRDIIEALRKSGKTGKSMLALYEEILRESEEVAGSVGKMDSSGALLFPIQRKIRLEEAFFVFRRK